MTGTAQQGGHAGTERAHLEIVEPSAEKRTIPLTFNPAQYQLKKTQNFAEIPVPGLTSPPLQWVRGGAETLSFEALLDTTAAPTDVDVAYVDGLRALMGKHPKLHAPPVVAFVWGTRRFTGVLDGLDVTYLLFDELGVPLRAKLAITLKEYRPAAVQSWQERTSSPDVEKTYLVRRGDTLRVIAAAVYRDPARWRDLARANGIVDPRALRPGRRLMLPTLR